MTSEIIKKEEKASERLEREEQDKKVRDRAERSSMLVTIVSGFVAAGASAVLVGYFADYLGAPKCVTYLSCAGGAFGGFFGGLYLGHFLYENIKK